MANKKMRARKKKDSTLDRLNEVARELDERTPVYMDDNGVFHDGQDHKRRDGAGSNKNLDAYGQLIGEERGEDRVLGENAFGERYYEKNGREYVDILDPEGKKKYTIQLKRSEIGVAVNESIEHLRAKGKIDLKNPDGEFYIKECEMPFVEKEGDFDWYAGRAILFSNGKRLILVDSRSEDSKKIAMAYHELVHVRDKGDKLNEHEIQLETIHGLREMLKEYERGKGKRHEIMGGVYGTEDSYDVVVGDLRGAVNYAIKSGKADDYFGGGEGSKIYMKNRDIINHLRQKKKSGLESAVEGIFFMAIGLFLGYVFVFPNITGFSISNAPIGSSNIMLLFFLSSIIYLAHYIARRKQYKS